ncbi:MAG: hypothetical protein V8S34_08995 [Lawsonibacter sp.]
MMVALWLGGVALRGGGPRVAALCHRGPLVGAARWPPAPCGSLPSSHERRSLALSVFAQYLFGLVPGCPVGRAFDRAEQHHLLRPPHRPGHAHERPGPAAALLPVPWAGGAASLPAAPASGETA